MSRLKSMPLIAATLLMCLGACTSASKGLAVPDTAPSARRAMLAPLCPTPTSAARLGKIAGEIDRAVAASVSPDVLATEWERLDAAARKCRGL